MVKKSESHWEPAEHVRPTPAAGSTATTTSAAAAAVCRVLTRAHRCRGAARVGTTGVWPLFEHFQPDFELFFLELKRCGRVGPLSAGDLPLGRGQPEPCCRNRANVPESGLRSSGHWRSNVTDSDGREDPGP